MKILNCLNIPDVFGVLVFILFVFGFVNLFFNQPIQNNNYNLNSQYNIVSYDVKTIEEAVHQWNKYN